MMEVERQIINTVCEVNPDADRLEKLRRLMRLDFDGDHLLNLAIKNGVGGLLYRNLEKADSLQKLDPGHRERLQSIYYQTVRLNLKLIHDLKKVLHKLDHENINVVLLQGMALLNTVYKDIGLRPMKDIDLWVLPDDYSRLVGSLEDVGFQREAFYPQTCFKCETAIDINTHILWADRIKARGLLLNIGQKKIFENAHEIDFEGQKALCLNPYDQVLYLSLHVIKHHAERLIWLVDVKGLIKNWTTSEWNALIHRATELGLEKTVAHIVYLLKALLDYQPGAEIQPVLKLTEPDVLEKKILNLRKTRNSLPAWCQFFLLPAGKSLLKRLAFISETLFPRPEILRQVFANSPNLKTWQLYWKRGLQLLGFPKSS